jgi:formylglycine-generating enzyme required for sulfatase activity
VDLRNGDGTHILKQPGLHALRRIIEGPAQQAGVTLEEGLADEIIQDTGTEPGSFALMAVTLERLYAICRPEPLLTKDAYRALDGVPGSIAQQADRAFAAVGEPARDALPRVFRELVGVSPDGTATRRRAALEAVAGTAPAAELVHALIEARLLVAEEQGRVEVAHEKLFDAWGRLERWIGESADDLRLIAKVRLESVDWDKDGRAGKHLWGHEKLQDVVGALARLGIERSDLEADCQDFIRPEAERLLAELEDIETPHNRRAWIGDRLAEIDDPRPGVGVREDGTPDIDWIAIPGGEIELKRGAAGTAQVAPFHMSRYLVTNAQFQAFVDAQDGYGRLVWWKSMREDANKHPKKPRWPEPNRPRRNVTWYEAVAFCRWLLQRLDFEVRLPTEHEWQQAATSGHQGNAYPWGPDGDARHCNTSESGLNRTVAVGLYPAGASAQGVLDLSGNLLEWCLNKYHLRSDTAVDRSDESRGVRGGSWLNLQVNARADHRRGARPGARRGLCGFRVVCSSPIR